jgi:hypothetical protein
LQFAIIAIPTQKESWLHSVAPERISRMIADERHGDTEPRGVIDYIPGYNHYSDRVEEEDDEIENTRTGRTIEDGTHKNNDSSLGQQPQVENEWART